MIIAELAGGRHPFALTDGTMMNEQQMRAWLAQRPIDLSSVADPRVMLLCQGLLTRDRRHRWGADQVNEWLAGRSPLVLADRTTDPVGRARTVLLDGVEYSSPADLATAFQHKWSEAFRRLFQERDAALADEVERLLRHKQLTKPSACSPLLPLLQTYASICRTLGRDGS